MFKFLSIAVIAIVLFAGINCSNPSGPSQVSVTVSFSVPSSVPVTDAQVFEDGTSKCTLVSGQILTIKCKDKASLSATYKQYSSLFQSWITVNKTASASEGLNWALY